MRRGVGSLVAMAVAGIVAVTGCSSSDPASDPAPSSAPSGSDGASSAAAPPSTGAAPSGGTSPAGIEWANQFCQPLIDIAKVTSEQAPSIDSSSPEAMRSSLAAFFGSIAQQVGGGAEKLRKLAPSPIKGGNEAAQALAGGFDQAKTAFEETKTKLANGTNPDDLAQVMSEIGPKMQELGSIDPLGQAKDNPELTAAIKDSPTCQAMGG